MTTYDVLNEIEQRYGAEVLEEITDAGLLRSYHRVRELRQLDQEEPGAHTRHIQGMAIRYHIEECTIYRSIKCMQSAVCVHS